MAALAVNGVEGLSASDIELSSPGPSYTADTLERVRDSLGLSASQIFFITGADAFADIETWKRYPEVLDLAEFVAVSRPGVPVAALRQQLPALKSRMRLPLRRSDLPPAGGDDGQGARNLHLSRRRADIGRVVDRDPPPSCAPDSRSMELVPAAVEHHIRQHGLYIHQPLTTSTADHLHGEN